MRTLLLMRGAPGCGKSTWIEQHGLRPYTLCADDVRMMIQAPQLNKEGKLEISQTNDRQVWELMFKMLEMRMQRGDLTVIDATNSKTSDMKRYKDLAKQHRYRVTCIDMTDVPIDVCKAQNAQRPEHRRVPENAIEKMYARFATQGVPAGISTVRTRDWEGAVTLDPVDLSEYKQIVVIGDIHGCVDAVGRMAIDLADESTYFIYTGDYIDRGPQSVQMCAMLHEIKDHPNVCILEGNHERWLKAWGDDIAAQSKEFEEVTRPQFEASGFTKKNARELYYRMRQCIYFTYHGQKYFVCHGGISNVPDNGFASIATEQLICGVGRYSESGEVAEAWTANMPDVIQIHAHRNVYGVPIKESGNVYNLEGGVERGGELRVLRITADGIQTLAYRSSYVPPESLKKKRNIL